MTIQLAHKRVLAFIRGSSPAALEIDYMEYATDGAAQSAYVTSGGYTIDLCTSGTADADSWQVNPLLPAYAFNGDYAGNANYWQALGSDYPHWLWYDFGAGVSKTIIKYTLRSYDSASRSYDLEDWVFQGSNNDSDWDTLDTQTGISWTQGEFKAFTFSNSTAYRYYRWYITACTSNHQAIIHEAEMMEVALNSYSESTIKTQGSYALKLSATTDALNETVTKTLTGGDILDLTGKDTIKLDARSTGTGSNMELSIRDSGNENSGNLFIEAETDITDKNGTHTITANGDAVLSKAQFSGYNNSSASVALDGTGDFLTSPDSADWDIAGSNTEDYTLDFWVKHTDHVGDEHYITQYEDGSNYWRIWHRHGEGLKFNFLSSGSNILLIESSTEITDTDWHHIELSKETSVGPTVEWYLRLDGVQTDYLSDNSTDTLTGSLYIGTLTAGESSLDGYMDNIRITKGTALWTSNFNLTDEELLYAEYQTHTINIASADTYQTDSWDISGVADADKDAIDSIQFKVLNAGSARDFFIDNIYAE
jgi:hypothetical protein